MKTKTIILFISVTLISACANKPLVKKPLVTEAPKKQTPSTQQSFFANLKTLCGQVFTGASTFPDDPEHDFAGKLLVADFVSCEEQQVRIKFDVGEDRSRTWVLSQSIQGLLLKHDHRHDDGTLHEVTNYGGWANEEGTAWRQHFVADGETAQLIPAAKTNVWMLQYDPSNQVLTYDLKRHDLPRYQAQLKPKQ